MVKGSWGGVNRVSQRAIAATSPGTAVISAMTFNFSATSSALNFPALGLRSNKAAIAWSVRTGTMPSTRTCSGVISPGVRVRLGTT